MDRIHVLGSGDAFNRDGRGSQALWVEAAGAAPFLIDAGPTLMAAAQRDRVDHRRLSRLFVTHLHGDHIAGWPFLALHLAIYDKRSEPLTVVGPTGTRECLEQLTRCCYGSLIDDSGWTVHWRELPVERRRGLAIDGAPPLDVEPMEHHSTSIGFRFRLDSGVLAVTGDTGWCAGIEELARDCRVLILECSSVEPTGLPHISLEEVRRNRAQLETPRILLNHLTDAVAEALAADPIPGVSAAYDGMVVELDAAS